MAMDAGRSLGCDTFGLWRKHCRHAWGLQRWKFLSNLSFRCHMLPSDCLVCRCLRPSASGTLDWKPRVGGTTRGLSALCFCPGRVRHIQQNCKRPLCGAELARWPMPVSKATEPWLQVRVPREPRLRLGRVVWIFRLARAWASCAGSGAHFIPKARWRCPREFYLQEDLCYVMLGFEEPRCQG